MTLREKREKITDYCNDTPCYDCLLNLENTGWCFEHPIYSCNEDALDEAIKIIGDTVVKEETEPKEDVVNHPSHYTNGGMECIDEMVLIFGEMTVANFCLCNVWKYRKRALYKNGEEDLKKADWYMNKYKELICKPCKGVCRDDTR